MSNPNDRYQNRIAWLAVAAVAVTGVRLYAPRQPVSARPDAADCRGLPPAPGQA